MKFTRKEIKGNVYGKLQATGEHYRRNNRIREQVKCLNCGWVHYVDRPSLLAGNCGCRKCSHMTHGLGKTRFYNIYRCMTQRCGNKKNPSYKEYGGRGIECVRKSYQSFIDDMYESYVAHVEQYGEKETSIDRIDVNGNYCKENCRRATNIEQANNTRRNSGVYKFARETGIPLNRVSYWHYSKGLTLEQIQTKFKEQTLFNYTR